VTAAPFLASLRIKFARKYDGYTEARNFLGFTFTIGAKLRFFQLRRNAICI
jgi:hypothetical protein